MHIRFWKDKQMCRVFLRQTGRTVNQTSAEIYLISHMLGAISSQTSLVSVNGCTGELIPKLDQSKLFKFGVSSSIRFEEFSVATHHVSRAFGELDFSGRVLEQTFSLSRRARGTQTGLYNVVSLTCGPIFVVLIKFVVVASEP